MALLENGTSYTILLRYDSSTDRKDLIDSNWSVDLHFEHVILWHDVRGNKKSLTAFKCEDDCLLC
jgi:hypothetical protein